MPTLQLLGLGSAATHMPLAYVLAPTLFLGPLYASYLDGTLPGQVNFGPMHFGLAERRNYVVVRRCFDCSCCGDMVWLLLIPHRRVLTCHLDSAGRSAGL